VIGSNRRVREAKRAREVRDWTALAAKARERRDRAGRSQAGAGDTNRAEPKESCPDACEPVTGEANTVYHGTTGEGQE
jgi:hypothetical protein